MRLANTYGLTGMVSLNGTVTRPQLESLVSAASAVAQQCLPGSSGPALYSAVIARCPAGTVPGIPGRYTRAFATGSAVPLTRGPPARTAVVTLLVP